MTLVPFRTKRDFAQTPEPHAQKVPPDTGRLRVRFVV
jgi:hypothetical protein